MSTRICHSLGKSVRKETFHQKVCTVALSLTLVAMFSTSWLSCDAKNHQSQPAETQSDSSTPAQDLTPVTLQRIGMQLDETRSHPRVLGVATGGPAALAGLEEGDRISATTMSGSVLSLTVKRDKMRFTAQIDLARLRLNYPNNNPQQNFQPSPSNISSAPLSVQGQDTSPQRPFELKAERVDTGAGSETRLLRPGVAAQDQLAPRAPYSGGVGSNTLNGNANSNAMALVDPRLFNQTPGMDQNSPFTLRAQNMEGGTRMQMPPIVDINSPIKVLSNYQIELIVDHSLSMRKRDCPGGLSRWEWCGMQAQDLSRGISPFVPNGLTITPFAAGYDVYKNSSPQNIADVFGHAGFSFGTRLAEPLNDRLGSYFKHRDQNGKPLLIVVITDGVPFPPPEPDMVISELVKASHKMRNANEVTVVFFQVGGKDRFGHDYLQYLDQNLGQVGARYHYVHSIPFEQLRMVGLARALVQTVQTYGANQYVRSE